MRHKYVATAITNFDTMKRLGFEWAGTGLWVNRKTGHTIWLNEDYRTTFRAATGRGNQHVLRNAAGNEVRFRTGHAAAKALNKEIAT
jgi:hypothetical protein